MSNKFVTDRVTLEWAYLNKPDDKFGADAANFNVTVKVDSHIQDHIKKAVSSTGAKKVNGVYEKDGEKFIKFKNRILVRDGAKQFPCVDSQNKATNITASAGDVVRLLLSPSLIKRDNSLSIYLDGVQIIEKNSTFGTASNGFDVVEDGFVSSDAEAQAVPDTEDQVDEDVQIDDDDLPF